MSRYLVVSLLLCVVPMASGQTTTDLLGQAQALMPGRYQIGVIEEIIRLYEQALAASPNDPQILGALAKLWFEWTVLAPPEKREAAWRKSLDYGLPALGLPKLSRAQSMKEAEFLAALGKVSDPALLVWPARSWDRLLSELPTTSAYAGVPKVLAMYRRAIELDERYHGGEALRALGVLLASLSDYKVFGATLEEAKTCFDRAIAAGPDYLPNYVWYARSYAVRAQDPALFDELLRHVLAAPIGNWPFWNENAKAQAVRLLGEKDQYFK